MTMEYFPDDRKELVPEKVGVKTGDIDKEALFSILRFYLEEALGEDPGRIDDDKLLRFAGMTRMLNHKGKGVFEVNVYENAEFRFGSKFSGDSKLWFRRVGFHKESAVYLDFDANMEDPPAEYFEAKERFKTRVGEYLISRDIAIPTYR